MKKKIIFIVFVAFAFNNAGNIILVQFLHYKIQEEIRNKLNSTGYKNKLHTISIDQRNQKDLEWSEDKEFLYHGTMYDVVKQRKQGSTIIYYCVTDTEETELFETLEILMQHQLANSKISGLLKNTYKLYWTPLELPRVEIKCKSVFNDNCHSLNENFITLYNRDIPTPPPKST
ncbi:MAG TPA: hypothetical protein VK541_09340 [Pedobacter sp.]|uniref:hypothetical protein n=1 Tax=Pedobacter sp. TaxID=1411316 RepID=UPI002BB825EF|nr:hypothetical protein [Pedobacter sp.]HMI02673.1 hypothetical protein [Pedobacter sp.]